MNNAHPTRSKRWLSLAGVALSFLIFNACSPEETEGEGTDQEDARVENGTLTPDTLAAGATCDPAEVQISVEILGFLNPVQTAEAFFLDGPSNTSFPLTRDGESDLWKGTIPAQSLGLCSEVKTFSISVLADDGEVSISENNVAFLSVK